MRSSRSSVTLRFNEAARLHVRRPGDVGGLDTGNKQIAVDQQNPRSVEDSPDTLARAFQMVREALAGQNGGMRDRMST